MSEAIISKTIVTKLQKNVLVDVKVEADLSGMIWGKSDDLVKYGQQLEKAVKEFHDFLRDHRSQDLVWLQVDEVRKDLCGNCGKVYEPDYYEEDKKRHCAWCGAINE